jgi:hypothetical protein
MKFVQKLATSILALGALASAESATGIHWIDANTNLTFYGDIRLRYEVDWDSQTAGGVMRDDRHRGRFRGRLGFNYRLTDEWSLGARVRTGHSRSQQSPHLTFVRDDGDRDDLNFIPDRYFFQYQHKPFTAWGGRNLFPFWQQNELFWDEDVTMTGAAASYDQALNTGALTATAGAFYLPDGGYDVHGQLIGAQIKYTRPINPSQFTMAAALHYMHGEDEANNLLTRNGEREYLIGVGSAQWSIPIAGRPLALGADLFYNFENYDATDVAPFPSQDDDKRLGYVFSLQYGQLKEKSDWFIGYYYAHIETFAVNASYAQDDWHRFGNGPQTTSSDFQGHEFRVAYALSKNINLMARLYLVEAITTSQDGNRFRLDLNWKF